MGDRGSSRFGCVVLAGGKGSRLGGVDKARLTLGGRTYLERIASQLEGFEERLLSGGDSGLAATVGFRHVPDSVPGLGPLGGLRDALSAASSDVLLVVPCDLPYFRGDVADALVRAWRDGDDALVLSDADGRLQPLCGLYALRCLPVLEARLARGERRAESLAEALHARVLPLPEAMRSEPVLHNVNRPEDLP
jgi:molybdopterin-guanine dinucleotide biosynthesis protein A